MRLADYQYSTQAESFSSETMSPTASNSRVCNGKTYEIQSQDDCYSISTKEQIGTAWLLTDNNLQAYCNEFPKNGSLCLVNKCSVYTVEANDTCSTVATKNHVTETQLKFWNPVRDLILIQPNLSDFQCRSSMAAAIT